MTLQLDGMRHPMTAQPGGWWSATGEGRDYGYVIDDADAPRQAREERIDVADGHRVAHDQRGAFGQRLG